MSNDVILNIAPKYYQEGLHENDSEEWRRIRPTRQVREYYPSECGTSFRMYMDDGGNRVYEPYQDRADQGHRKKCPICARRDAHRKALKAYHRLFAYHWENLWGITLTTPSDFLDLSRIDEEGYPEKRMKEFKKLCQTYMDKFHSGVPYSMAFHHWKTKDPVGKPHFHMHITAICCQYEMVEGAGILETYIEPRVDLDDARAVWSDILGVSGSVDLHYQFMPRKTSVWEEDGENKTSGGSRKIRHWLNYCYRYYVQDLEKYYTDYEFVEVDEESRYWVEWHNRDWGRRINGYGALSKRKSKYFVKNEIIEGRVEEYKRLSSRRFSPFTGNPIDTDCCEKVRIEGLVRGSSLVIRQVVKYLDYPAPLEEFTVYLPVPKSCMRWSEFHSFKKKRLRDKDG